jgi:hypothetical protein
MNWGIKSAGTTGAESGHVIFIGCNGKIHENKHIIRPFKQKHEKLQNKYGNCKAVSGNLVGEFLLFH